MSSSLDYFARGIAKATERRAMLQQQQAKQIGERVHGGIDATITKTTNVTSINTDTISVDEERYRTPLITNMIKLIHSKRK
ncbi:hypothetical protein [Pseudomonas simiae]|uniref:hypothetical protein n=1 Tax=Pseudomonas simiae TaxID=321846 RepID=UPI0027352B44|nr:hypothetical protein [Pseudomonas simiae]WLG72647.1 hypothetical protein PSH60_21155 [Pseudomonas simiae]